MYAICCLAAGMAADLGVMRPFAPPLLAMTSVPAYLVFFGLVRSGRTRALKDPTLMVPQNLFALMAIGFAYTAVGPNDRGVVLVLLALVMVFGMYTHTPKQSAAIGVLAVVALAVAMAVLSWLDPVYYPPCWSSSASSCSRGPCPSSSSRPTGCRHGASGLLPSGSPCVRRWSKSRNSPSGTP